MLRIILFLTVALFFSTQRAHSTHKFVKGETAQKNFLAKVFDENSGNPDNLPTKRKKRTKGVEPLAIQIAPVSVRLRNCHTLLINCREEIIFFKTPRRFAFERGPPAA
jgi:hypothetical protein